MKFGQPISIAYKSSMSMFVVFAPISLIPASVGKIPPVQFCLCISKTVRLTVMCFWDFVQDAERYISPLTFYHISTGNINMAAWKPEVHFRKSAKSHMPDSKSPDYKQHTFSSTTLIFSWPSDLHLLLAWFFDVSLHWKCNMADK